MGTARYRRMSIVFGAVVVAVAVLTGVAAAAESRIDIEPGAEAVDRAALVEVVRGAEADGLVLSVSVLASDRDGGPEAVADDLVDRRGGVALVITPTAVGAVSDTAVHDTDRAVDAALDELAASDDVVAATEVFVDRLVAGPQGVGIDAIPGLGRVPFRTIMFALGALFLLSVLLRGSRRRRRHRRGGSIAGYGLAYGAGRRAARRSTTRGSSAGASRSRSTSPRARSSSTRSRATGSRSRSSGRRR